MSQCIRRAACAALLSTALVSSAFAAHAAQGVPFEALTAAWTPLQSRAWMTAAQAAELASASAASALAPSMAALLQGGGTQSGEAVISEFMKDPAAVADTRGEWIEVYNNLPWRLNLEGWTLADDSGSSHVIHTGGVGVLCRPGRHLVLGNNADMTLNGGVRLDYVWSGFSLSNTSDSIILLSPTGGLVDRVAYTSSAPWPSAPGRSISLQQSKRNALDNDDGANWCLSSVPMHQNTTDTGTPGRDNDACP
ncbi:MAG: lamin tail domain-containing protein [Planctomycetes bacterium]|nr:lamin tail domain-containing protein [Planctomycetota bacterium]